MCHQIVHQLARSRYARDVTFCLAVVSVGDAVGRLQEDEMMAHLDFKGLQIRKRAFIRKDDPWIQGAPLPSGSAGSPVGEGTGPWQHDAIQSGCCSECRLETTVAAHHCYHVRHVLGLAGSRYYARKHHELSHISRLHALRGLSHILHQTACPAVQDNSCWT
jgi:hypothetical protein